MKRLLMLWLCLTAAAQADVYQWQDTAGGRHFSDQTHANAQKIDIQPGYGFYHVKTVYDGDTVVLDSGRKVRFLGINTPEVPHHGKPAQAGGEEAKQWLMAKLKNTRVRLETSAEQTDKYGRTLAHVFTEQKDHINLQLVEAGLASVSIFPPNLLYVKELVAAEQRAEQAKRGIWQRPQYAPIAANRIDDSVYAEHQWQRVTGKVRAVHPSKSAVYLEFTDTFAARIDKENLPLFADVNSYVGKNMEVRGWLNKHQGRFSMLLRHPSSMR
jgi:endonuclease YncB( thermonuclease family)